MAGEVVMLKVAAEVVEGVLDADQAGGLLILALDVRVVVADDHADAWKMRRSSGSRPCSTSCRFTS